MATAQPDPQSRRSRSIAPVFWIGAATALVTILLMAMSGVSGGFASAGAAESADLGWAIRIHLATALAALLLGPILLWRRKGDRAHRLLGRVWAVLMLTTALASAFIRDPGGGVAGTGFSFIHLFTVWTLISLPLAIAAIRAGKVEAHRKAMTGLYIGLCTAGAFTLIPGRLLGNLAFG